MARRTTDATIPDLGEKISELEGILGYRRDLADFRDERLGQVVGAAREHFGRMRRGKCAIADGQLSRLIAFFELGPNLDYQLFRTPFDEFKQRLREGHIGTYAGNPLDTSCAALVVLAKRLDAEQISMTIRRRSVVRRGGLGLASTGVDQATALVIGDKVDLSIEPPCAGHLTILSHHLGIELTCLMPSLFAPDSAVPGKRVVVPTSPTYECFDVTGPCGRHRIFAIWTSCPVSLPWLGRIEHDGEPGVITGFEAGAFVESLQSLPANDVAVYFRDYTVQERKW